MRDYSDILHKNRPASARPKMDLSNRAKIFAPFDALRGFNFAVMATEAARALMPRVELSEDSQQELNQKLAQIRTGETVTVCYFTRERQLGDLELGSYHSMTGQVQGIDEYSGALILADCFILIADIRDLRVEGGDGYAECWKTEAICGGAGNSLYRRYRAASEHRLCSRGYL